MESVLNIINGWLSTAMRIDLRADRYEMIRPEPKQGRLSQWLTELLEPGYMLGSWASLCSHTLTAEELLELVRGMDQSKPIDIHLIPRCKNTLGSVVIELLPCGDGQHYLTVKPVEFCREEAMMVENALVALGNTYDYVFCVELTSNTIVHYRHKPGGVGYEKRFFPKGASLEAAVAQCVEQFVHEKDRERIAQMLTRNNLVRRLNSGGSICCDFTGIFRGTFQRMRMKIANADPTGKVNMIAAGIQTMSGDRMVGDLFPQTRRSLLIVSSAPENRKELVSILESEFHILLAENARQAMQTLVKSPTDIAAILLELRLPNEEGIQLMQQIGRNRILSNIPIVITTDENDLTYQVESDCLKLGASEFVARPYNPDMVMSRVSGLVRLRQATAMIDTLRKDPLTGLYTREFFYRFAEDVLEQDAETAYEIVCTDIEHFKLSNDRYGTKKGNEMLAYLANRLQSDLMGYVIGGRLSGDIFAVLRRCNEPADLEGLLHSIRASAPIPSTVIRIGLCAVTRGKPVQIMCDHAQLAIKRIEGQYATMISEYNDSMRLEMLEQQQILDQMEQALEQRQFRVFCQPKINARTEEVICAEALVRWHHPELGLLSPKKFIPLFERNGFVTRLDAYIWEEVCFMIQNRLQCGKKPVPISVNFSRRDFESDHLVDFLVNTANRYQVPHELLHLEITETVYSDNPERVSAAIRRLRQEGFVIELDDFGSGYASLNTLSNLNIDILKLDMSLVRSEDSGAGRSVLEFTIGLARLLNMQTVAEGVETKEQVERLKELGCDMIQGYYYAKPMSEEQFSLYLENRL